MPAPLRYTRMFFMRSSSQADERSAMGFAAVARSGSVLRSEPPAGGNSLWMEPRRVFGRGDDPLLVGEEPDFLELSMCSPDLSFSGVENAHGSDAKPTVCSDASMSLREIRRSLVGLVMASAIVKR
jgi:hypothetical protein